MMEDALTRQTAERLIEAATTAPSLYNSQPWQFVAWPADRVIEIYADPARAPRRRDPRGRAVHIACGSALFNLRLAIARAGYEPVARLLPSPRDPLLLASVRLAGPYRPRPAERDLYAAIRLVGHAPFTGHPPRGVLVDLKEAAAVEGASLRELGPADGLRILPGRATGPDLHRAAGRRVMGRFRPMRDLSPGQLAVISTGAGDRASWLRAGQAAQHVLLLATHHGVQAALLGPAPEAPGGPAHGETALAGEHPAVILQFGSGHSRPVTARRPVAQVLRVPPPGGRAAARRPGAAPGHRGPLPA
jgi:Nitroreductase family